MNKFMTKMVQLRTMWLAAALGLGLLAVPGCKSQDPAVSLSIDGAFRVGIDADTLRLDVYDAVSAKLLVTQTFPLPPGTIFPYTVTVVEDSGGHSSLKLIATATLSTTIAGWKTALAVVGSFLRTRV